MLGLVFLVFPFLKTIFHHWGFLSSHAFGTPEYTKLLKIHFFPFLLFLGNISYACSPTDSVWLGPLWTLSLEEQFYLFCPILFYIFLPKH